jgi:ABC-type uncharacterized transport system ATPase subunit
MKISKIKITNFKRFTDLEIDISVTRPKLVVLVGPNGFGKSSVFDAFEQIGGRGKPNFQEDAVYLRKDQSIDWAVNIESDQGNFAKGGAVAKHLFYLRSAYRFDAGAPSGSIQKKDELLGDSIRPKKMIDLDTRVQDNYERLVGATVSALYSGAKDALTVEQLREELIGKVRAKMLSVFPDLILEGIGNPLVEGQFFFTKGNSQHFPYRNLSAGEKGAFDILLDLIIKTQEFNNTVIAIDEPELHMHSGLQRALLAEVYNLVPNDCQVWVATHSIGFIRGAIELLRLHPNDVVILNFTDIDFDTPQVVKPTPPTAQNIREIFKVAIDDLSNMLVPSRIIICEGSLSAPPNSSKKEFDTKIYNNIFSREDVFFISGDNKSTAQKSAELLFKIISQSGSIRNIASIVDRDGLTAIQISNFQASTPSQRFLSRRAIENYLLDSDIIDKYCDANNVVRTLVTSRMADPVNEDAKAIQSAIMQQCGFTGNVDDFKLELAKYITSDTTVYSQMKQDIGL